MVEFKISQEDLQEMAGKFKGERPGVVVIIIHNTIVGWKLKPL